MVLEQKIGFDKVREKISAKCATQYAVRKVAANFEELRPINDTTPIIGGIALSKRKK